MQKQYPLENGPDSWTTEIYIAHYSERLGRAVGFAMASSRKNMPPGYRPWAVQPLQECCAPGVDLAAIYGAEPDTADPTAFPIEHGALAIIEAQRRERWDVNGGPEAHRVGGAAELTAVTAHGVRTRTLRTSSDKTGARIVV